MEVSKTLNSKRIFSKACEFFPGGVNSPVRSFAAVESSPFIVQRGEGPFLVDVDGYRYIDFVCSWGPLVLGHADPDILLALQEQMVKGTSYGACCELEITLAEIIKKQFPSVDLLRFTSSGTEAGMAVIRLARGYTGKNKIIKFSGCYHGHADSLLVKAGSGLASLGLPGSAGVASTLASETIVVPYNNLELVEKAFQNHRDEIAAVILEPVIGNSGFILPLDGYLSGLKRLCQSNDSLLIFDEVMTGFRVHKNGAQGLYNVKPDLTMFGKVIGGGLPVGAFGGRKEIMEKLAPLGNVYQAGTLSGNPLAMAAGVASLNKWLTGSVFEEVEMLTKNLIKSFRDLSSEAAIPLKALSQGSMFGFFFSDKEINNYEDAQESDQQRFVRFFNLALSEGLYFAPSAFEAGFVSSKHDDVIMDRVHDKLSIVFNKM